MLRGPVPKSEYFASKYLGSYFLEIKYFLCLSVIAPHPSGNSKGSLIVSFSSVSFSSEKLLSVSIFFASEIGMFARSEKASVALWCPHFQQLYHKGDLMLNPP